MLDVRLIRREPEQVRAALARRGPEIAEKVDRVLELDELRREILPTLEAIRAEQNAASREIGAAKQRGEDASGAIAAMEDVAARGRELSDRLAEIERDLQAQLSV
ncbi:MAG: seryl-tRNA synthetase, partial [Solirubrobacteraceae bacterium]|nr:seryl-tRNA synthetase [Solirubrobacteraceae bacterium]